MRLSNTNPTTGGYAILSAILLTGFLLILTAGTFHLVLQELYDGRGKQNYLKAYAAAEAGLEEALYLVKEYDYGYHEVRDWGTSLLGDGIRIPQVAFDFESKSQEHTGSLRSYEMDIIPLFWRDTTGVYHNIAGGLHLTAGNDIAWNIVGLEVGVGGNGGFSSSTKEVPLRSIDINNTINLTNPTLDDFLAQTTESDVSRKIKFMIIINNSDTSQGYTLKADGESFTLPRHDIVSSGRIGRYTQNIRTEIDNTEYLGLLRYSIFGGE